MGIRIRNFLLPAILLALSACATQGVVLTTGVGAIRTSVTTTDAETHKIFGEINAAHRGDVIQMVLLQKGRPNEAIFNPVITPETAARWAAAFDGVDKYLACLQDLVDPKRSAEIGTQIRGVGEALQAPAFGVKVPGEVVGLFASLGEAVVQAAAEKRAQDIMRRTDPQFKALMAGLADLVGEPGPVSRPGTLRAMVDEHWVGLLGGVENSFTRVLNGSEADRRPLLVSYGELLDERQLYRDRLARLRTTLLAIAEAHSAAATGSPGAAFYWIGQINGFVQKARADAKAEDK